MVDCDNLKFDGISISTSTSYSEKQTSMIRGQALIASGFKRGDKGPRSVTQRDRGRGWVNTL